MRYHVQKDLRHWRNERVAVSLWLAIPLIVGILMTLMGGNGGKPVAHILIVDQDDSFLSGLVAGAFNQGPMSDLFQVQQTNLTQARQQLDQGEASALLRIPAGFGDAVLNNTATRLQLVTNPAQRILPKMAEQVVQMLVQADFYLQREFGPQIKAITQNLDQAPSDARVASISTAINQSIASITPYLSPPLLDVDVVHAEDKGAGTTNLGLLFLPGLVMMAALFAAGGLADNWWYERELGTLRRLAATPLSLDRLLLAKTLVAGIIVMLLTGALLAAGFAYHGLSPTRFPAAVVWMAASGILLFTLFSTLKLFMGTRKAASVTSTIIVFPMMMLGGSFFPFEVMPAWLAQIGRALPNGFAVRRLNDYLVYGASSGELLAGLMVLIPVSLVLLVVMRWRLQRFARQ